jgi:hypothetical protein
MSIKYGPAKPARHRNCGVAATPEPIINIAENKPNNASRMKRNGYQAIKANKYAKLIKSMCVSAAQSVSIACMLSVPTHFEYDFGQIIIKLSRKYQPQIIQ